MTLDILQKAWESAIRRVFELNGYSEEQIEEQMVKQHFNTPDAFIAVCNCKAPDHEFIPAADHAFHAAKAYTIGRDEGLNAAMIYKLTFGGEL